MAVNWGRALMGGLNGGAKAFNQVLDERRKEEMDMRRLARAQEYAIDLKAMGIQGQKDVAGINNERADKRNQATIEAADKRNQATIDAKAKQPVTVRSGADLVDPTTGKRIYGNDDKVTSKGGASSKGGSSTNWNAMGSKAFPDDPYSANRVAAVAERMQSKNPDVGEASIFFEARKFVEDNPVATKDEITETLDNMPSGWLGDSAEQKQAKANKVNELINRGRSVEPAALQKRITPMQAKQSPELYRQYMLENNQSEEAIQKGTAKLFGQRDDVNNVTAPPQKKSAPTQSAADTSRSAPTTQSLMSPDKKKLMDQLALIEEKIKTIPTIEKRHGHQKKVMAEPKYAEEYRRLHEQKSNLESQLRAIDFMNRTRDIKKKERAARGY